MFFLVLLVSVSVLDQIYDKIGFCGVIADSILNVLV